MAAGTTVVCALNRRTSKHVQTRIVFFDAQEATCLGEDAGSDLEDLVNKGFVYVLHTGNKRTFPLGAPLDFFLFLFHVFLKKKMFHPKE